MKTLQLFLLFIHGSICIAQINVIPLNDVPEDFKKKYYSQRRDYNPLQVGNLWQYYDGEYNTYVTTRVVQDSVINGKRYFKKIYYQIGPPVSDFVAWERNDTVSGVSFMLDFEDVNENGDYLEDLPVDSLENPYWSRYTTYKYSFARPNPFSFFPGQKSVLVEDTSWVRFEGDTVLSRFFSIGELFWEEEVIEKFGVFSFNLESPNRYCIGAIINRKKYGTIVGVEDDEIDHSIPTDFILENNFPNPFNPTTTIKYQLSEARFVTLKVYDILGREVAQLVNETKSAGYYEVNFDASRLTSGVYIYTIQAGKYTESKKMILAK